MSSSKYRIYCQTEGKFVSAWSVNPPSVCPNNEAHTVNPGSVSEDSVSESYHRVGIQTNSTEYVTVMQLLNHPSNPFQFMKMICSVQDGEGRVRLYDITNVQTLAESNTCSNVNPDVCELPPITFVPEAESIVEVQAKKNSGSGNMFLETIFLYQ